MAQELNEKVKYHPKKSLAPLPVFKGVRMWSVALERTMLTYFEIDPRCRFNMHSHMNEQITMVLEGELFLKSEGRVICVKKGEVIAIHSNAPHEAFTKECPAIAVDAWSPVMEKYRPKAEPMTTQEREPTISGCPGTKK
jgi:quercetin dioxygenase-like cupin family protein